MKQRTLILIFILGLYSCNDKSQNIDGTWILSNTIYSNGEIEFVDIDSRVLLKIEGKKLKIQKFRAEKGGEIPMDTTVIFELKNNQLEIENFQEFGADLKFKNDSLVGTFIDAPIKHVIFKKLSPSKNKISWNPNGKNYQFEGNKGLAHADFINDSTMFEYNSDHNSVSSNKWWFEQFENYTFLVLQYPISTVPFMVDSVSGKSIFFKSIEDKVRKYEYQEQTSIKVHELLGEWKLTDKKYDDGERKFYDPFSRNNIEHLTIFKDSVILVSNGQKSKHEWTLSGSGKMMFVADKKYGIFRILELGQKTLALEISLEGFMDRKRSIYQQE